MWDNHYKNLHFMHLDVNSEENIRSFVPTSFKAFRV